MGTKIAFYCEDGLEQLVLTPDDKREHDMLALLTRGDRTIEIKQGSFYGCQGGWVRWKERASNLYGRAPDDESCIIVMRKKVDPVNDLRSHTQDVLTELARPLPTV